MRAYIETIAPKMNEYLLKIVKDWYSVKLQCSGLEARVAKEIEMSKKGLQGMINALNKELDLVNADKMEQIIEVENTKAKFKDLQMKEQELMTIQIKMGDVMQVMDKRVRQIIELEDSLSEANEVITEKDERIVELEREVEDGVVEIDELRDSLNAVIDQCKLDNSNLKTTIAIITDERDNARRDLDALLKEEQRYQDSLVSSSTQVGLKPSRLCC